MPHGAVEINWQKSTVINGETRWIWVYTPPGYEKEHKRRYPVLYLFHGSNDTAGGWTLAGHANFILDNLLAEKKAVPMIIVMPFGHAVPFGARGGQVNNTDLYEQYMLKDVMPLVEVEVSRRAGPARTAPSRGSRWAAGRRSRIGFRHLDLFSAIGAFSAAMPADFEKQFPQVLANAKDDQRQAESAVDRLRQAGQPVRAIAEVLGTAGRRARSSTRSAPPKARTCSRCGGST